MISKFKQWYRSNYEAITWFLIGWLCFGALAAFGRGSNAESVLLLAIAFVNYIFIKRS